MTHRALATVAGFAAVLALAACGSGSTGAESGSTPSITAQTPSRSVAQTTQPAAQEIDGLRGFISPTGNVACMIAADWARCDIIDRDWSPPLRPADCEFDYGQGISVAPGERAQFVCAGDTAFGPDAILPYGESTAISRPPTASRSLARRISCSHLATNGGSAAGVEICAATLGRT